MTSRESLVSTETSSRFAGSRPALGRGAGPTPVNLPKMAGVLVAVGTVAYLVTRPAYEGGDAATYASAALASCACLWVLYRSQPLEGGIRISAGVVTSALFLIAFFFKYVFGGTVVDYGELGPSYYSPHHAMRIASVFVLMYCVVLVKPIRVEESASEPVTRLRFSASTVAVLAFVTIAARLFIARRYSIGVPGKAPQAIPGVGVLYYLTTYVPPIAAVCLFIGSRASTSVRRILVPAILVTYALVGALIGYRSYALAGVVLLATVSTGGPPRRIRISRAAAVLIVVVGFVVLGVSAGLGTRSSGQSAGTSGVSSTAGFLSGRIGGLDYLSPVVGQVEVEGVDPSRLRPAVWEKFLLTNVYRLPYRARTGFAGTAPGWLYAGGGIYLVATGALVAGCFTRSADRLHARTCDHRGRAIHAALALAWVNFFLEGTPRESFLIGAFGSGIAFMLMRRANSVGRWER